MIFPINKKHTFFSKEKTLLTFFLFSLFLFLHLGSRIKADSSADQ